MHVREGIYCYLSRGEQKGKRKGERKRGDQDNSATEGERGQEVTQQVGKKREATTFLPIRKNGKLLPSPGGSQGENHSWRKQILGSSFLAMTFTRQGEKSQSLDTHPSGMPCVLPQITEDRMKY